MSSVELAKDSLKEQLEDSEAELVERLGLEGYLYVKHIFQKKILKTGSWGVFSSLLMQVQIRKSPSKQMMKSAFFIELFIIATDFVDDYMDGDNEAFNDIQDRRRITIQLLNFALEQLLELLPANIKRHFMSNLESSLTHQMLESKYQLYFSTSEAFYFRHTIERSVYLIYAMVIAILKTAQKEVLQFSYFWGAYGQIENDIDNIEKGSFSDVLERKPTLPIIKAFESISSDNAFYDVYFSYIIGSDKKETQNIAKYILNSGAIEYSRMLSNKCYLKALKILSDLYPGSERMIKEFDDYFVKR